MFWDKEAECTGERRRQALINERLKTALRRAYRLPFYRKLFNEHRIRPQDIKGVKDLPRLPFTTKKDLVEHYPFGFFAVPLSKILTCHATSGTTGRPLITGYTRRDLNLWAEVMARCLTTAGVRKGDIAQNAYGYGLFTGGLGFHYGLMRVGALVIPISSGATERQLLIMRDFQATVLCCTPTYALHLGEEAQRMDMAKELKLRVGVFGAEPWSEGLRRQVEERLNLKALDIYGLAETVGPGVSVECEQRDGMHINEDHFYPEIINPATGEVLGDGEVGELVITALTRETLPILRYRTRDLTRLNRERCRCGRTLARMDRIIGRSDDMLIIRGINFFPSQLETLLMEFDELEPQYIIRVFRKEAMDEAEVKVEAKPGFWALGQEKVGELGRRIGDKIHSLLGLRIGIEVVEPRSIERSMGKAKRVLDERPR